MSGLRKRLASFRPLTESPVSDVCLLQTTERSDDEHELEEHIHGKEHEKVEEGVLNGSMLQSFSSISSHSSEDEDSEHEPIDTNMYASGKDAMESVRMESNKEEIFHTPRTGISPKRTPSLRASKTRSPPRAVRRGTTTFSSQRTRDSSASSTASWLGYDLSIIVALVSPIGNILTGSDHIKNILLLLFLIYYLHQLVEVPWTLYRMSIPSEESFIPSGNEDPTKLAAYAELRSLEIFYLVLTVLSPFLGATLLRFIATAISGNPASLSWFSTSLFVLATGIRPWSHLTERLKSRSRALKALVEEADVDEGALVDEEDPHAKIDEGIADLRGKYDSLDKRLTNLDASSSREWDDLVDAIDAIEASVRKSQTETNKKQQEWDARLGVLETYVLDLHRKDRQTRIHDVETYMRGAKLRVLFWNGLALPWTLSALVWGFSTKLVRSAFRLRGPAPNSHPVGPGVEKPMSSTPHTTFRAHVLETIVEEDLDSQVQDNANAAQSGPGCIGNGNGSDSSQTLIGDNLNNRTIKPRPRGDIVIDLILDLTVRVLTFVFAPALFFVRMFATLLDLPRSVFRAVVQ